EKLHEVGLDFEQAGLKLEVIGLEAHRGISSHPRAARRRTDERMRRISALVRAGQEDALAVRMRRCGVASWTVSTRTRRTEVGTGGGTEQVLLEATVPPDVAARVLEDSRGETGALDGVELTATPVDAVLVPEGGA
ncbi:MAG: hypothetical protein ACKOJI_10755, partial [Phycisphaerales bacterium]